MDIRKARAPKGTMPPRHVAPETPKSQHADISEAGIPEIADIDQFGGDLVIKGYMDFLKENDISEDDIKAVQESLLTSMQSYKKNNNINQPDTLELPGMKPPTQ